MRWRRFILPATIKRIARALSIASVLAGLLVLAPTPHAQACAATGPPRVIAKQITPAKLQVVVTNSVGSLLPMQQLALAGRASDTSPTWTNDDGRVYWYRVDTAVGFEPSYPCSGQDRYQYWFNVTCRRRNGTAQADTPCYFDSVNGSIQAAPPGSGGSTWTNPLGWHKYVRSNDTECEGLGSPHYFADDSWTRTGIIEHLWFRNPFNTAQLIHETATRYMHSYWVNQVGSIVGSDSATGNLMSSSLPTASYGPDLC